MLSNSPKHFSQLLSPLSGRITNEGSQELRKHEIKKTNIFNLLPLPFFYNEKNKQHDTDILLLLWHY